MMCVNQVSTPLPLSVTSSAPTMAAFESQDATFNFKSGTVMTGILNAHIRTLIAFKDTTKVTLLKVTSKSVLSILTIIRVRPSLLFSSSVLASINCPRDQDEMIEEDLFVGLAEISGRTGGCE